jgi:hypothetical protein
MRREMDREMDLVREVLDNELVAKKDHQPIGMADGVILQLRDGQPPRVVAIECGFPVLARRIHPRIEKWVRAIGRRWGVWRGRTHRIPWSRVRSVGIEIEVEVRPERSPNTAWERYLVRHFIRHIPGGKGTAGGGEKPGKAGGK